MNYPFTAIVGQEKLKKALLLCAINPGIGGLLIQGDKGTAKSTAARALAKIVPPIVKIAHCRFNCAEHLPLEICEACQQAERTLQQVQVPFVNLPVGATEERVIGSLDLEGILTEKKKKFQPGLLAAVHQGILYIDEVNLLPDHLVDVLLDVAAMGENMIEREGLSLSHPSRFTLIGTMNPEEGQLRPQFLDRFGLMVNVEAPEEVIERTEVVRRRIAYENDPASFVQRWEASQADLQQRLLKAKQLLPAVQLHDDLLTLISELTTGLGVKSLRADIVMYKTAVTLAALDQRTAVTAEDVREAAILALAHRSRRSPMQSSASQQKRSPADQSPPETPPSTQHSPRNSAGQDVKEKQGSDERNSSFSEGSSVNDSGSANESPSANESESQPANESPSTGNASPENGNGEDHAGEQVFEPGMPVVLPLIEGLNSRSEQPGKRSAVPDTKRGAYIRPEPVKNAAHIAVDATVLHALQRNPAELDITMADLHQKQRKAKMSNLILFVVDASGSMAASKRMEAVKGTVLHLLKDAYQKRDTVGVIAFRGIAAQVLLHPTQNIEFAEEAMRSLPTGGRTPLPHALQTAVAVARQFSKDYHPILIILTDGKANVALEAEGDPWDQTLALAGQLKDMKIRSLVLNTASGFFNLNKAEELAVAMDAKYMSLHEVSPENLTPIVSQLL
ncbi:magnesium chelatase subunit D family protein [Pedobacter hartonius]|uniref:Mg-protoporphyrin IX chelatase n=1 Tax=Pedobacter hartonius TaxID=425514 RepID=A0A1H4EQC8_9SPHI|nr:magnesium chelatase subunit D family protein [Pedobacter hartonius]SEA86740.1 protoporphyrin IX magnesium-chelatase [Pedobacter hartonius]